MRHVILTIILGLVTVPVAAQTGNGRKQDAPGSGDQPQQPLAPIAPIHDGRTAEVGNGQVGQRQTRAEAGPMVQPMGRIQSRIANRIQSRIRNRIDRNYDPQANAISPFRAAEEQSRPAPRQ